MNRGVKMPNYYTELPENAKVVKTIDAKNNKTMLIFNLIAIVIMILSILPIILLKDFTLKDIESKELLIGLAVYIVGMVLYVVLHELTHGLVYKVMTKQKLTFGITLSCAFCGVPNIYVTKKTALLAILAPFVVYTLVLLPIIILLPANLINLALVIIFGTHVSGCVGDLYGTYTLLKLKGNILMNDTGPKQTFYELS
jgi:hypothetical protein